MVIERGRLEQEQHERRMHDAENMDYAEYLITYEGYTQAPCDVQCIDRWPETALRPAAKAAYDQLARCGEIVPQGVYRRNGGVLEVRYLSRIPQQWQREELGRIAKQIEKA